MLTSRSYVDPNVELDIYADKPWAVSPTLATFNYLSLSSQKPEYAPIVAEDSLERLAEMYEGGESLSRAGGGRPTPFSSPPLVTSG